jgi:hypothetical protein
VAKLLDVAQEQGKVRARAKARGRDKDRGKERACGARVQERVAALAVDRDAGLDAEPPRARARVPAAPVEMGGTDELRPRERAAA